MTYIISKQFQPCLRVFIYVCIQHTCNYSSRFNFNNHYKLKERDSVMLVIRLFKIVYHHRLNSFVNLGLFKEPFLLIPISSHHRPFPYSTSFLQGSLSLPLFFTINIFLLISWSSFLIIWPANLSQYICWSLRIWKKYRVPDSAVSTYRTYTFLS